MHIVMFYHSLLSDWNHGNAHFLRGVVSELLERGHKVDVYEPVDGWSRRNLIKQYGDEPIEQLHHIYPRLRSIFYDHNLDLEEVLDGADLVLVHEWNEHDLVARVGEHRARDGGYQLLFHDTHHRSVTDEASMAAYKLHHYDGVLAFGKTIRDLYLERAWTKRAWTWHEAADTRLFHPLPRRTIEGDVVWIGNWGDEERSDTLQRFLFDPIRELNLQARVYGVRYPKRARAALDESGIEFAGWLPNYQVPEVFARYKLTVHVPRRPYLEQLPGVPTIRPFEALACGIPLISAEWDDNGVFKPGHDFLVAYTGKEMKEAMLAVLNEEGLAAQLAENGRKTILSRHTCKHRVDELLEIYEELVSPAPKEDRPVAAD